MKNLPHDRLYNIDSESTIEKKNRNTQNPILCLANKNFHIREAIIKNVEEIK
jgi:hypothetical protein